LIDFEASSGMPDCELALRRNRLEARPRRAILLATMGKSPIRA